MILDSVFEALETEHDRMTAEASVLRQAIDSLKASNGQNGARNGASTMHSRAAIRHRQTPAMPGKITQRHTMSASARRKISAAQKSRWAKLKGGTR